MFLHWHDGEDEFCHSQFENLQTAITISAEAYRQVVTRVPKQQKKSHVALVNTIKGQILDQGQWPRSRSKVMLKITMKCIRMSLLDNKYS